VHAESESGETSENQEVDIRKLFELSIKCVRIERVKFF